MKNTLIVAAVFLSGTTLIVPGLPGVAVVYAAAPELKVSPQQTEMSVPAVAIRLRRVSSRYVFDAELNGHGPWRFIVDLAHQHTLVDDNIVTALELKTTATPGIPNDDGTTRTANVVSIDSLEIGEVEFHNFDAVVSDLDALAGGVRTYDAVLGYSLFAKLVLMLDHSGGRMVLSKRSFGPVDGKEVLDMVKGEYGVAIAMPLGGTTTNVTLDTASLDAFALPTSMKQNVNVMMRLTGDFRSQKTITDVDLDAQAIKGNVKIGKYQLIEPPVVFGSDHATVGLEVLDRFTISLDQGRRRVKFERFTGDAVSFPIRTRWGIVFVRRGIQLEVVKIISGSLAEQSIIKEGDIITSFVGRPLKRITDADIVTMLKERDHIHVTVDRSGFPLLVPLDLQ